MLMGRGPSRLPSVCRRGVSQSGGVGAFREQEAVWNQASLMGTESLHHRQSLQHGANIISFFTASGCSFQPFSLHVGQHPDRPAVFITSPVVLNRDWSPSWPRSLQLKLRLQASAFDSRGRGFFLLPSYQILRLGSCFVSQLGCADRSRSLQYLNIGDNEAAIGGILITPPVLCGSCEKAPTSH